MGADYAGVLTPERFRCGEIRSKKGPSVCQVAVCRHRNQNGRPDRADAVLSWKTNILEVRVPIATGPPDFYTAYLQTIDAQ